MEYTIAYASAPVYEIIVRSKLLFFLASGCSQGVEVIWWAMSTTPALGDRVTCTWPDGCAARPLVWLAMPRGEQGGHSPSSPRQQVNNCGVKMVALQNLTKHYGGAAIV